MSKKSLIIMSTISVLIFFLIVVPIGIKLANTTKKAAFVAVKNPVTHSIGAAVGSTTGSQSSAVTSAGSETAEQYEAAGNADESEAQSLGAQQNAALQSAEAAGNDSTPAFTQYTPPATTYTPPNCSAYTSGYNTLEPQIEKVQDELANVDETAESEGGGYGVTGAEVQNQINVLTQQYDSQLNGLNGQLSNLKSEYPSCS